jgi:hypothetical protein
VEAEVVNTVVVVVLVDIDMKQTLQFLEMLM